jgi:DNA repair protein RadD
MLHLPSTDPPTPLVPRVDQRAAHDAVVSALDAGIRRPLLVAPMAWGKSLLLAMLASTFARRGQRTLILAHRRELLQQNSGTLRRFDPAADVGLCSASLQHDNTSAQIVVGGTATIYRRLHRLGHIDVVLLDEAHRITIGSATMLVRILAGLGNPPLIGLTATPFRGDGVSLIESGLFETIAHEVTISDALAVGRLCPLVSKSPRVGRIDTSGVSVVGGEFNSAQLERAAMAGDTTRLAVARTVEVARAENRKSWIIFSSGVAHAEAIGAELNRHGISNAVVVGTTAGDERGDVIERFRAGQITALINCNVFTEGFDATCIDLVAFMRATCSPVLWIQGSGRGMRLHPGKVDCRLLDFGNNIQRHGPVDAPALRRSGERHDEARAAARFRVCPQCDEANRPDAMVCACCGFMLVTPRPAPRIEAVESDLAALGGHQPGTLATVHGWAGRVHTKVGSPPSFRLDLRTSEGLVCQFMAFSHPSSGARWHAAQAWKTLSRHPHLPPPASADEAVQRFQRGELRQPALVQLRRDAQWWRIEAYRFPAEAGVAA